MKKNKELVLIIIIIFVFLSSFFTAQILNKERLIYLPTNTQVSYSASEKAILGLLGEFTHTIACYLWIKSDFYHHEYTGDWRTDKEIMPLIRLVTLLDPHFVQAYSFGGYHLAVNLNEPKEGLAYLKEGVKNNPDDYDINWTLSFVYWKKLHDYNNSVFYGKKALSLAKTKIDKLNSFRMIVNSYEDSKQYVKALEILNQMKIFAERNNVKSEVDIINMRINRIKSEMRRR